MTLRITRILLLLALAASFPLSACERSKSAASDTAGATSLAGLRTFEVRTSPANPPPETLPTPTELHARGVEALGALDATRVVDSAPMKNKLAVRYTGQIVTPPNSTPKLAIGIHGALSLGDINANFERSVLFDDVDATGSDAQRDAFLDAFDAILRAVKQEVTLHAMDDAALIEKLSGGEKFEREPLANALGRIRRHVATDSSKAATARALATTHLLSDHAQVVVAAAALATQVKTPSLGLALVEAATRMSQQNQPQAHIALLAQMGDVGGEGVEQYLEAVSTGHANPTIRQIASDSLTRSRAKK